MQLPQPGRKSQNPMNSLKFVQPFLNHRRREFFMAVRESGGAKRALDSLAHRAILGQSSLPVPSDLKPVFAEKHQDRDTVPAVDAELFLHVGMVIAVQVANVQGRSRLRKALEYRTLHDAIAAPDPSKAQHRHSTAKAREQISLLGRQLNTTQLLLPFGLIARIAVALQESVVGKPDFPLFKQVHRFFLACPSCKNQTYRVEPSRDRGGRNGRRSTSFVSNQNIRTLSLNIDGIKGLTRRHEKSVSFAAAEAEIAANFR